VRFGIVVILFLRNRFSSAADASCQRTTLVRIAQARTTSLLCIASLHRIALEHAHTRKHIQQQLSSIPEFSATAKADDDRDIDVAL
jgi:hypothetical protein